MQAIPYCTSTVRQNLTKKFYKQVSKITFDTYPPNNRVYIFFKKIN